MYPCLHSCTLHTNWIIYVEIDIGTYKLDGFCPHCHKSLSGRFVFCFLKFSIYLIIKDKIPWVFMYFLYVFVTIKNSQFSTPWSSTFEHQIGVIQQPEAYLTCATLEYKCSCTPGTPFTERMDVTPQFLRKSRRCEIGGYNDRIILQLDRQQVFRQRGCISDCQISEWPGDYKPGFETSWVFFSKTPVRLVNRGLITRSSWCVSVYNKIPDILQSNLSYPKCVTRTEAWHFTGIEWTLNTLCTDHHI